MIDDSSKRPKQLKKARRNLTAIVLLVMLFLGFTLSSISARNETLVAAPLPTPSPTLINSPQLITIEYQINVVSETPSTSVEFWYTNESGGTNQTDYMTINSTNPISKTVMGTVYPGEYVEVSGVVTNGTVEELSCQILIDGTLIEHSINQGVKAGIYCSGVVPE